MMVISFTQSTSPLFLSGHSRYCIDDNFLESVRERRTHHGVVIYKVYQFAIDLTLTIKGST